MHKIKMLLVWTFFYKYNYIMFHAAVLFLAVEVLCLIVFISSFRLPRISRCSVAYVFIVSNKNMHICLPTISVCVCFCFDIVGIRGILSQPKRKKRHHACLITHLKLKMLFFELFLD